MKVHEEQFHEKWWIVLNLISLNLLAYEILLCTSSQQVSSAYRDIKIYSKYLSSLKNLRNKTTLQSINGLERLNMLPLGSSFSIVQSQVSVIHTMNVHVTLGNTWLFSNWISDRWWDDWRKRNLSPGVIVSAISEVWRHRKSLHHATWSVADCGLKQARKQFNIAITVRDNSENHCSR